MTLVETVKKIVVSAANGKTGEFRLVGRRVAENSPYTFWEAQSVDGTQRSAHDLGFTEALEEGAVQLGFLARGDALAVLRIEPVSYREKTV